MKDLFTPLTEAGVTIKRSDFVFLSEAAKIKVADSVMTEMFKFITDKYNSIDFSEIESSAGDIRRFKYRNLVLENIETLENIYYNTDDPGAKKYVDVIKSVKMIYEFLDLKRDKISVLYKKGNGVIQLMYTSLVAATIYGTSTLVTNTIRFVTTETDTDMEVVFDEIPGSIKHVHIKNLLNTANNLSTFHELVDQMYGNEKRSVSESAITIMAATTLAIAGVIYLIPKLLTLIREIIYSIYFTRVKVSDMLDLQVQLIRTNIESLEAGRGSKKIIVRQRAIANKLERLSNSIAVKLDTAEVLSKTQQKKENSTLKIEKGSPLMDAIEQPQSAGLML